MPKHRVRRPKKKPAKKQRVVEQEVPADVDPWNASSAVAWNPVDEQSEDPWKFVVEEDDPWAQSCSPQSSVPEDPWGHEVEESVQSRHVSLDSGSRLLAESTLKTHSNSYEIAAMDTDRVRLRWAQKCPRTNCQLEGCAPRALHLKSLQDLCRDFWSITAEERVHLLQVTYGDGTGKSTEYYIGSSRVCFCNFCKKLGCSQTTMRKYIAGAGHAKERCQWWDQVGQSRARSPCNIEV